MPTLIWERMSSSPSNPLPVLLPWLLAGVVLFIAAALGGFGAAYLLTSANAVPTVDPAHLPTPTPSATPIVTLTPVPSESGEPTASAPASPTPQSSTPAPSESAEPSPESTPIRYVVKRGDRLTTIAAQFGVGVDEIVELNDLTDPDHIEVGQVLLIPVP